MSKNGYEGDARRDGGGLSLKERFDVASEFCIFARERGTSTAKP